MEILKGWLGEKKTQYNLWRGLDSRDYVRFHDTIFPSQNGAAQVDHLLVSKFGVFVVETKNYQGWIYGSEKDPKWTQTIYRKKSCPVRGVSFCPKGLALRIFFSSDYGLP